MVMEPYIGPDVRLGQDVVVHPFAYLEGHTTIGDRCEIFPHAAVGTPPHDVSYQGSATRLEIGEECIIREGVSIHRASEKAERLTRVGSRCFFMANSHVGHDARVGDEVILTNSAVLGGVGLERPADDSFALAFRVDVAGIQQVDAGVERPVEHLDALRLGSGVGEIVGAEAQRRYLHAGAA